MDRIALCIPAFNAEEFLPRLLQSATEQTIPFDEILVYDDASADRTAAIARTFGAQVVRGETNVGCSVGKNILARLATSEWLHFHDADDSLEPHFVATARLWMDRSDAPDVIFFSYRAFDHSAGCQLGERRFDAAALEHDAISYCLAEQINPFCGIYRRDCFLAAGGWDEDPKVLQSEDQAGHLRLAVKGLRFSADDKFTVRNYIRPGSMTTSNPAGAQRATYALLAKAVLMVHPKYHAIVAQRLWDVAGSSAAHLDWMNSDLSVTLAMRIERNVIPGRLWFRILASLAPRFAIRLREGLIRSFRPAQRRGFPFGS